MAEATTLHEIRDLLLAMRQDMVRREEWEALLDSPLILTNPDTRRQLASSQRDKAAGRVKRVTSVRDLLT